ncbi:hypothetical protein [Endozoicomonas sp.]|uniref:hypothetical protein n=1 Tax=Endozoicomonas sp. TaxID=1892382 RepID=UPI002886DEEB|nr:hypothetical protein [Endozoicomonas sp.]
MNLTSFNKQSLDGIYRADGKNIPQQLMDENIELALQTFGKMKAFQYIQFHLGKPTYVFLMEDSCPVTKDHWAKVSITDRGDMKYVFIFNDPRPEERWWIDYQPVDESGTPIGTERCVGWFTDEFAALEAARDILSKPDRKSRVN